MKREHVNYAVVGAFVIAVGAGLLATLAALTGRTGPTDGYHVHYPNVAGMKFGTPVRYEGYPIGQVERIEPVHAGARRFRVTISVQEGWPIPRGSVARVRAAGLVSEVAIDIRAGPGPEALAPGDELAGGARADIFGALASAAERVQTLSDALAPLAAVLGREVPAAIGELRAMMTRIREELDDPLLFGNLKVALARLAEITEAVHAFMAPAQLERISTAIGHVTELSGELVVTSRRVQQFLDDETRGRVTRLLDEAAELAGEMRESNRRLQALIDPENQANLKTALGSVRDVTGHLDAMVAVMRGIMSEGNQRNIARTLENAERVSRELGDLVRSLGGTGEQLDQTIGDIDRLVEGSAGDVAAAAADLRRTLQILSTHVEAIAYHLEGSSRNLHEFMREVRANPTRLLRSSAPVEGPQGQR